MRTRALSLCLIILWCCASAQASCRYFRVRAKAERCKVLPPDKTPVGDVLLQDDSKEGPSVSLVCACDYTLEGAAAVSFQCDVDHTDEPAFISPALDDANPCGGARRLCEDLCPKNLNL